ncbi:MAG: M48 family metalloprotease [Bacteroidota bacterium]|nr:M48 family metalloprotease [Bacteroidota bacterium]MDP4232378.1 M48 family metalloprotease [Bacteroidota bacterium]MDP4241515.1 M48 family metalloprotease [Bacteroidota bacterium]MDP4288249.1 M48 family metalloprotease [Bacteroidota bacterium]
MKYRESHLTLESKSSHAFVIGHLSFVIPILALTGIVAACASGGFNVFPKSDDVQLGQQMRQQIAQDPQHYPVLNNPTLTNYLQSIENRIVSSPNVTNKDFHYTITIINDPKTVNAFTIPAGGIYVYTGLLKFIDDESALAGVLAHETTHADHRHATRNMTQQYGLQMISSMAFGSNAGLVAQVVTGLGTELSVLKFSRDDEREADQGSFDDLNQLPGRPWYPGGVNLFLTKSLAAHAQQPGPFAQLFLTHPVDQQRIDAVTADVSHAKLGGPTAAQLNQSNYQRYKAMVP